MAQVKMRMRSVVASAALLSVAVTPLVTTGGIAGAAVNPAKATSAAAFGGMSALIAAAKKEGTLNVITLPADWANYGTIIKDFSKKYGIKVNSENPNGSSQDEINAVNQLKCQSRAPDVLDVGTSFALQAAAAGLLAPYKVQTWHDIPASAKAANGDWFDDYGGVLGIRCHTKTG